MSRELLGLGTGEFTRLVSSSSPAAPPPPPPPPPLLRVSPEDIWLCGCGCFGWGWLRLGRGRSVSAWAKGETLFLGEAFALGSGFAHERQSVCNAMGWCAQKIVIDGKLWFIRTTAMRKCIHTYKLICEVRQAVLFYQNSCRRGRFALRLTR